MGIDFYKNNIVLGGFQTTYERSFNVYLFIYFFFMFTLAKYDQIPKTFRTGSLSGPHMANIGISLDSGTEPQSFR